MPHKKRVELRVESCSSVMCTDSGDLWCSSDTSRCVAEKKHTEQQAKKLFPQVFVPVCNPDGTYSEVTQNPPQRILVPSACGLTEQRAVTLPHQIDFVFTCHVNDRFSATATLATVGASPPMVDPSAAQQWPIKNQDVKVSKAPAACLKMSRFT